MLIALGNQASTGSGTQLPCIADNSAFTSPVTRTVVSRAHTGHDYNRGCLQHTCGHVLDENSVSGCTACPCRLFRCAGDGYTTASKVCSSSMPSGTVSFLGLLSGPGYAISSNAPDSEIHASVFHTLDVETDGWLSLLCPTPRGRGSWSFQRHQDTPSRSSRLPDVLSESSTADPGSLAVWVLAASSIRHRGSSWRVTKDPNVGRDTAPVKTRQLCLRPAGRTRQD